MKTITIDGPGKNALSTHLLRDLVTQIEAAGAEPLLVTGSGDAFSAGLDLKEVHAAGAEEMRTFLVLLQDVMGRLFHHPAPTVAAVNGHAIAGGCLIALMCDHRVAERGSRARIGLNEVALGLRFPPRVLAMARSRVPVQHHHEVFLGARLVGVDDALRLGLVDELAVDVSATATDVLTSWSRHPRDAYQHAKHALRSGVDTVSQEEQDAFENDVLPVWHGPEIKATLAGFLKR